MSTLKTPGSSGLPRRADQIIGVDQRMVERFMGGTVEHPPGEPYVETTFRTVLFTDIAHSTSLTQQLGDARAMEVLRTHDEIVRRAGAARSDLECGFEPTRRGFLAPRC